MTNDNASGILELTDNGAGFLRRREANYLPSNGDLYVRQRLIREFGLRSGDEIVGTVGKAPGRGKSPPLTKVVSVNDRPPQETKGRPDFNRLAAIHPNEQ